MKGGINDTSKCTVQAKHGRNGKVVFANLPRLGYSLAYGLNIIVPGGNPGCQPRGRKKLLYTHARRT